MACGVEYEYRKRFLTLGVVSRCLRTQGQSSKARVLFRHVRHVLFVFEADVLEHVGIRQQPFHESDREGFGERLRSMIVTATSMWPKSRRVKRSSTRRFS